MESVACNLCGGTDTKTLYRARDILYKISPQIFSVVRCTACGLVYVNPRPTEKEIENFYPQTYHPYQPHEETKPLYKEPMNPTKRILDLGCGSGSFLEKLHERNPSAALFGLDFSPHAAETTRRKGFPVVQGTLADAHYADNYFDEVYLKHVLEHIHDPMDLLKQIRRILKPGGSVIIMVPNFRSFSRMLFGKFWYALETPRHLYHFTPSTATKMFKQAGFSRVDIRYTPTPKFVLQSLSLLTRGKRNAYPRSLKSLLIGPAHIAAWLGMSGEIRARGTK